MIKIYGVVEIDFKTGEESNITGYLDKSCIEFIPTLDANIVELEIDIERFTEKYKEYPIQKIRLQLERVNGR